MYVPALGRKVKGTVFSVVADNLGAHGLGGFVENFSGSHVCRFCLGERSQFQVKEVRTKVWFKSEPMNNMKCMFKLYKKILL